MDHPYKFVTEYAKRVAPGDKKVAQNAWSIVNDSYFTPLCLLYRPQVVACGALYLGAQLAQINLNDVEVNGEKKAWFEVLDCKVISTSHCLLLILCGQVLFFPFISIPSNNHVIISSNFNCRSSLDYIGAGLAEHSGDDADAIRAKENRPEEH